MSIGETKLNKLNESDDNSLRQLIFIDDNCQRFSVLNINGGYEIKPEQEQVALTYIINIFKQSVDISKNSHGTDKIIINVFLDNYKSKNIRNTFVLLVAKMLIKLFPNNLELCHIINSPPIFDGLMKLIRLLLSQENNKKIILTKLR